MKFLPFILTLVCLFSVHANASDANDLVERSLKSNIKDAVNILKSNAYIVDSHRDDSWDPSVVCWEESFADKFDEIDAQVRFLKLDILKKTSGILKSFCTISGDNAGFSSISNTKEGWLKRLNDITTILNLD